jgi:hypothetical protein
MNNFIIFGLPRSRTFWLSRFLCYGDWHCGHDEIRYLRGLDDIAAWFKQENTGTVETAAAPWWRLVNHYAPDTRMITIRRDPEEVIRSMQALGFSNSEVLRKQIYKLDCKLDQLERRNQQVLSFKFEDLTQEETCAKIFEHCLPYRHDRTWWQSMADLNLQINMRALMRYMDAHHPQLEKLEKTAKQKVLSLMEIPQTREDGITFQEETVDDVLRDGVALFREHSVSVGEAPDSYLSKNLAVMRSLEEVGAIQFMTARCNGRMFGYLMAIICPSLEDPNLTTSIHTLFYASPEFKGLGMKLQRESVNALKRKGVGEVVFRAGVRGSGHRISAIYKRMGAEDYGQLFKLDLR